MSEVIDQGPRRMPSLLAIVKYWRDAGWAKHSDDQYGWGEPFCFRFGWLAPVDDSRGWEKAWERSAGFLERAHLIDRMYGGPDIPENHVPLCCWCHDEMPSFKMDDYVSALEWVGAGEYCDPLRQFATDHVGFGGRFSGEQKGRSLQRKTDRVIAKAMLQVVRSEDAA